MTFPREACNHLNGEERELVALLNLSSWCLVMVEWLFLFVPWGCVRFVIVVFPDHTHLLFLTGARPLSTWYNSPWSRYVHLVNRPGRSSSWNFMSFGTTFVWMESHLSFLLLPACQPTVCHSLVDTECNHKQRAVYLTRHNRVGH